MKNNKYYLIFAVIFFIFCNKISAEDILTKIKNTENKINSTNIKKTDLEKENKNLQRNLKKIIRKQRGYLNLRYKTEKEMYRLRNDKKSIEKKIIELKKNILKTEYEIGELSSSLKTSEDALENRVVSLYKLGKYGYIDILLDAENLSDLDQRQKYLFHIIKADAELINNIIKDRKLKEDYQILQKNEFDKLEIEFKRKKDMSDKIIKKKRKLENLIKKLKTDKQLLEIKKKEIKESIKSLDNTINNLMNKRKKLKEEELNLKKEFDVKKGKLIWPTEKTKIVGYKLHPFSGSKGIKITIQTGSKVFAVSPGTIVYADWMKGFGKIILIDHGGGYFTVYAHLSKIFVKTDEKVKAKTIIGETGETGSDEGPKLYFEIKYNGISIDVKKWLKEIGR